MPPLTKARSVSLSPSQNVQTPEALRARLRSHRPSGTFRNRLYLVRQVQLRCACSRSNPVASEKSLQEIGDCCVKVIEISGLAQGLWRNRDELGTRNESRNSNGV